MRHPGDTIFRPLTFCHILKDRDEVLRVARIVAHGDGRRRACPGAFADRLKVVIVPKDRAIGKQGFLVFGDNELDPFLWEQIHDRLADELGPRCAKKVLKRPIDEAIAIFGSLLVGARYILDHDRNGDMLDDGVEKLLRPAQFVFRQLGLGDIVNGGQTRTASGIGQHARVDGDIDGLPAGGDVLPDIFAELIGIKSPQEISEPLTILGRAQLGYGHRHELLAAIAVADDCCVIDRHEAQAFAIDDPHRHRVAVEQ